MKYIVRIGDHLHEVTLEGETATVHSPDGSSGSWTVRVADIPGTPVRLVTMGDAVHRVIARRESARGTFTLRVDGWTVQAEALDERQRAIQALQASSAPTGPAPVVAPMPGLVVRVAVQVGDTVSAGQGVVVMEAMKMENELKAAAAGVVKAVRVSPGQAVEKGAVLVDLE
jgi:biotin carboxyl carrier protein